LTGWSLPRKSSRPISFSLGLLLVLTVFFFPLRLVLLTCLPLVPAPTPFRRPYVEFFHPRVMSACAKSLLLHPLLFFSPQIAFLIALTPASIFFFGAFAKPAVGHRNPIRASLTLKNRFSFPIGLLIRCSFGSTPGRILVFALSPFFALSL